jgi:hypothetical protein
MPAQAGMTYLTKMLPIPQVVIAAFRRKGNHPQ